VRLARLFPPSRFAPATVLKVRQAFRFRLQFQPRRRGPSRRLAGALALVLAAFAATPASQGLAQAAADPAVALRDDGADAAADRPIPDGYFFSEALGGRADGAGFAVQDGGGAALWTAFQDHGGIAVLGYPSSRRFSWDGRVAQAFGSTILRWDADRDAADVLSVRDLPDGTPSAAVQPDWPPRAAGEAATTPWSGWWWPASDGHGPSLFAPDSPLAKYDSYVAQASGEDPGTRGWERERIYFPNAAWAGHCNGWAAAALLEPEPTEGRQALGIQFGVADQKALLTDYHFGDGLAWTYGGDGSVNPAQFHRVLLDWLGLSASAARGFVLTFDLGQEEVWSYPVYKFASTWSPDPVVPDQWHVTTTVWMADMDVPPGFVGLQPYPGPQGKTLEYVLQGDPRHPTDGQWTGASAKGRFSHPGQIWYPEPRHRNVDRELVSPALELATVRTIMGLGD